MKYPLTLLVLVLVAGSATASEDYWWPEQTLPSGMYTVAAPPTLAGQMMVQSVAGLAARAVNAGSHDEMVWIAYPGNPDYDEWRRRVLGYGKVADLGSQTLWGVAEHFIDAGVIQGYVLYRDDTSPGNLNEHRPGMDLSANVATSVAGLLGAVVIEESLRSDAEARGLTILLDARDKTPQWCFDTYRDQFSRQTLMTQDPRKSNARAMAIAHGMLTLYGYDAPLEEALAWLTPPAPILGWNGGDERMSTGVISDYGHFVVPTDWALNLPVLMAGAAQARPGKVDRFDPRSIDWRDKRNAISFILSDGDNVQWYLGGFFQNEPDSFWSSPDRGYFHVGWSCPFANLRQLAPPVLDYVAETGSDFDWMVEWGGGYYYPDRFAVNRPDRAGLLAEQARRTWARMQETNTEVVGFICDDVDSPAAIEAYETFAREMPGLLGMVVFQYYPYEGGEGKVMWVPDSRGYEVPVVSTRYAIWNNTDRPLAGTPAKVARLINEGAAGGAALREPAYEWAVAHAWSWFQESDGDGDHDEDMPQENAAAAGGKRGLTPIGWCTDRLSRDVNVVSPQELLWRIRMQRNPEETRELLTDTSVPAVGGAGLALLLAGMAVAGAAIHVRRQ